jgi:hypothetical protein
VRGAALAAAGGSGGLLEGGGDYWEFRLKRPERQHHSAHMNLSVINMTDKQNNAEGVATRRNMQHGPWPALLVVLY